jgi:DNA-binding SARP family transcriptional activator/tetratricopeptide (TPR) repeat protein
VTAMEFRVLGPLEAYRNDKRVELGARRRERCLLGVLLLEPGRLFSVERLVELLWDEEPPAHARSTVSNHVSRLRSRVDPDRSGRDGVRLIARGGGYLIDLVSDRVDAHRFTTLVEQAETLAEPADQSRVLRGALALWRGPLLADVCTDRLRARLGTRLNELRLTAIEAALLADLGCGRPGPAAAELAGLVEMHPDRERLLWLFMLALYRSGRQTEALAAYHRARQRLADQFGLDLGAEVQSLHEAILRCDPGLELSVGEATAVAGVGVPARPAQLPAPHRHFVGRVAELRELDGLLAGQGERTVVVISAIAGTAGVGKTALAVSWAHQVADRFPDGQLYVNLRGFDPSGSVMGPADAVRRFLDALQVPPQRISVDLDAQAALYRSEIAGKRMLVVLDNARDTAQVRPLLPGAPTCLVLVTSRNQLTGLIAADGAHPITLDLLTDDEARQLLAQRLGADRVAAEPAAVGEIINRCAHLPLALALVAARAALSPRAGLSLLAEQLRDAEHRWQMLTGDDPTTDLQAVFSWSYQALTPDAARLFRLLGLHPGPDLSAAAAASLAGLLASTIRPALTELTQASLLVEHIPGRYTLHDLLRAYATDLTQRIDSDQQRHSATVRVLDHYLHTAHTANRLLHPARDPITLAPPAAGVAPQHLADYQQALDWFTVEHAVLLAAVEHAATGFATHTWQLAWILDDFLNWRGHWHDWAAAGRAAVAAAHRLTDPTAQAHAHRTLARAYILLGRLDDAHTQLGLALHLATRTGDQTVQAHTHGTLGYLWGRRGNYPRALDHAQQALTLFQTTGHQHGQANALNAIGWYHAQLGDHHQALTACQVALTLHQELGNRPGQATTWDSLGYAHHHLGNHIHALTCYQHALTLYRDLGDRYNEATTLTNLGDTHHSTGNHHAAHDAWQQALTILDDLDHPDAERVRAKLTTLNTTTP